MTTWHTLDQFEEHLRHDPDFRAKLEAMEPRYLRAHEMMAGRLAAAKKAHQPNGEAGN